MRYLLCLFLWSPTLCALAAQDTVKLPTIEAAIPAGYKPATGSEEADLWASLAPVERQLRHSPLVMKNKGLNDYLKSILCRLDGDVCHDIRIYVVRNPNFNAMMYPNGMMVIWTGLLLRMQNEAQLATVMGHELGHYLRQHGLQSWDHMKGSANASLIVGLVSGAAGAPIVGDLINLGILANIFQYSRENEREADIFGVQRMAAAGYDPHAAAALWAYVEHEEQSAVYKHHTPVFFRSHPVNKVRFELLSRLADQLPNSGKTYPARYWHALSPYYLTLVGDQLQMNKPGRTEALLRQHQQYAIDVHLVQFAWGEFYSMRSDQASITEAITNYQHALQSNDVPAGGWRDLGILELKSKDYVDAKEHLEQYLRLKPEANDTAIVKFYLTTIEGKQR